MAPASKVWSFIAYDPATKTMLCPPCGWRNVGKNATRGVDHVLKCTASLEANPGMVEVLRPPRSSTNRAGAAAPVTPAVLLHWRTMFATAMFEAGLPIGFFDTAAWRSVFLLVSGGTFDGPGSRGYISSVLLPVVARSSDDAVRRHLAAAQARAASIDGATFNHKGVINVVIYTPRPLLIGTARLGTEPSSAVNLRAALTGVLAGPMMAAALPQAQVAGGAVTAMQRFCGRGPQMLVTDSPSNMVRMRTEAVRAGAAVFSLGCAAHAGNLVARDAAKMPPFSSALRHAVSAAVFVTRCARAGALHIQSASNMTFNGRRVRSLKPYSRTRWVGQAVTVSAAQENMAALRLTLFSNGCAEHPFDVPASVTAAVEAASAAAIDQSVPFLRVLAAVVALLEGDGAPLSSYAGLFSTLRSSLDTHFLELPAATRQALQDSISKRFGAFSDPMAALAFYLDGFWTPARGRVAGLRWGEDGRTLPALRDAAVETLAGGDAGLLGALRSELSEVLAFLGQPEQEEACRVVHPLTWWRLSGECFPLWHPIAIRLFCLPPSAAGGERAFKALGHVFSPRRNRTASEHVDTLTRIMFNAASLRRRNPVTSFSRSSTEKKLLLFWEEHDAGAMAPGAAGGGGGGGGGAVDDEGGEADGDEEGGEYEEDDAPGSDLEPDEVDAFVNELLA